MRVLLAAFLLITAGIASGPVFAQAANEVNAAAANAAAENRADENAADANAVDANAAAALRRGATRDVPARSARGSNDPRVAPESAQAIVKLFVLAALLEWRSRCCSTGGHSSSISMAAPRSRCFHLGRSRRSDRIRSAYAGRFAGNLWQRPP